MKGIKLTPLNMFLLLLLVLVISLWLGYSVKEGATSMSSATTPVQMQVFAPYSADALVVINGTDDVTGSILFDPKYGNFLNISAPGSGENNTDANNMPFTLIQRNGTSKQYTPVEWITTSNMSQMHSIGQSIDSNSGSPQNFAWSYTHLQSTVINVTWDKKTIIYHIDNANRIMNEVFVSTFFSEDSNKTYIDTSIKGMPLPSIKSNVIPATSQKLTQVEGVMAYQISESVFFNFEKGIFVKTPDGFKVARNSSLTTGSSMEYDNLNNASVVSTKFMDHHLCKWTGW